MRLLKNSNKSKRLLLQFKIKVPEAEETPVIPDNFETYHIIDCILEIYIYSNLKLLSKEKKITYYIDG